MPLPPQGATVSLHRSVHTDLMGGLESLLALARSDFQRNFVFFLLPEIHSEVNVYPPSLITKLPLILLPPEIFCFDCLGSRSFEKEEICTFLSSVSSPTHQENLRDLVPAPNVRVVVPGASFPTCSPLLSCQSKYFALLLGDEQRPG